MRNKVDAYCNQVRTHGLGGTLAEPTPRIVLSQVSNSLIRVVIVEDVRHSASPRGARSAAHSDVRIRFDISEVIGAAAVLDD